jgi:hypothetical protein
MQDLFDCTKHPQQDAVDAAHEHVMRIIQLYASGLVTMPELLAALQPHYALFPTEDDKPVAIVGVLDPATHLKRVK